MATINSKSFRSYLSQRSKTGNKYTSGRLIVDAGSQRFPGAAVLTLGGARRGGAGYINYIAREEFPTQLVLSAYPDVVPLSVEEALAVAGEHTFLVGPGSPQIDALPNAQRMVVDGGALVLVKRPVREGLIRILTPHEGEFRQMGYDSSQRESSAVKAARELNSIILLKGFRTIIATPTEVIHVDDIGGPELSTAGTGDVLAGLIASMIAAAKPETLKSAGEIVIGALTIFTSAGKSSLRKRAPLVATDLIEEIPRLLAQEGISL